jgi:hypothetical protein
MDIHTIRNRTLKSIFSISSVASIFLIFNVSSIHKAHAIPAFKCIPGSKNAEYACGNSSSSNPSSRISSNNTDRTQAVANMATSAIYTWDESRKKQEAEREAKEKTEHQREVDQFNKSVSQVRDDDDTNPWGNSVKNKKIERQNKQPSDSYIGNCIEQNFSMRSDGQFALRNTCNYPINLKYTLSSSKPFAGTYITLQPNQVTFETGKIYEKIRFQMCPVPKVPQSLDGGCI